MRLLNTTSFELRNFSHNDVPKQYAILSHNWGAEEDEIRFRDIQQGRLKEAQNRPIKLRGCCKIAKDDGYDYIWVDTCCIDNTNSVELQEAINSMFEWYKNSAICYVFLSDIPANDRNPWDPISQFSSSRWFERGWTLQELLAPSKLRFYNCEWHCLGSKGDLCPIVQGTTKIPSPYLLGISKLREASVAQRMSWAAKRVTKRPEDIAYCLLGIFGLTMPMIYGEGSKRAFVRLQELIMKEIGDDSILAWGLGQTESTLNSSAENISGYIFASSPAEFENCHDIQVPERITRNHLEKFGGNLRLNIPLFIPTPDNIFGLLKCGDSNQVVGIPLMNISQDVPDEYIRPQDRRPILVPKADREIPTSSILIRTEHEKRTSRVGSRKLWFNVQGSAEVGLDLIEVEPQSCWRKEEALIEAKEMTLIRFRPKLGEAKDFLVFLGLGIEGSWSEKEARCHVMTCERDTSLRAIARRYSHIRPEAMNQQSASNNTINLQVVLEAVQEGTLFFLRIVSLTSPPNNTFDATIELQIMDANVEITLLQEEESAVQRKAAVSKEAIQVTGKVLAETNKELELLQIQLNEMKAKEEQLVIRLKRECEEVENLYHHQKTSSSCLESLANRRLYTQQRLESFSDKAKSTTLTSNENGKDESEAENELPILSWAAKNGYINILRRLLDVGVADINLKSGPYANTALHHAATRGHRAVALLLLSHGADIDSRDKFGETPLFDALKNKHENVSRLLVDIGANIKLENNIGETPLFSAVRPQLGQIVPLLLNRGANIDSKNKSGDTPLFDAVRYGHEQTITLLVEKNADINLQGTDGRLPLHLAAKYAKDFAVQLFLNNGVDIEAVDDSFKTALHYAAKYGHDLTTELLLQNHATVDATDNMSRTPLHLAAQHNYIALLVRLIKHGANVNAKDSLAKTPLHFACQGGYFSAAELLVQEHANIEEVTNDGETPLYIAVQSGHEDIVKLLTQNSATIVGNKECKSPLHKAAFDGNLAILETLLRSDVDRCLSQVDNTGYSPLDYAIGNNQDGAAKLLRSYGALEKRNQGTGEKDSTLIDNITSMVAINITTHNESRSEGQDIEVISSHSSAPSPNHAARSHSALARKQFKSSTSSVFDKLKRRKGI